MKKTFLVGITLLVSISVNAEVTDFSQASYDTITSMLGSNTDQKQYLDNYAIGTLGMPTDTQLITLSNTGVTLAQLRTNLTQINTYLPLSSIGLTTLDGMASKMTSADSGGIGFLDECVQDITREFTTVVSGTRGGVYCSNAKFFKQYNKVRDEILQRYSKIIETKVKIEDAIRQESFTTRNLQVGQDATVGGRIDITGDASISGNLQVKGNVTRQNNNNLNVTNNSMILNYAGNNTSAAGAGIYVQDGVGAGTPSSLVWNGTRWTINNGVYTSGLIQSDGGLNVAGTTIVASDAYVEGSRVRVGTIGTSQITNLSVNTEDLADSSVTTAKIADGNVVNADLGANSVTTDKIADSNVLTADIADGNVVNADLGANSVTTDKIEDRTITNFDIKLGAVDNGELHANSVTYDKIADGNVLNADLGGDSVTTDKIANGAVTNSDLGQYSINWYNIADGQVDGRVITNNSVSSTDIANGTIQNEDLNGGNFSFNGLTVGGGGLDATNYIQLSSGRSLWLNGGNIYQNGFVVIDGSGNMNASRISGTISNGQIANDAVTSDKIADRTITNLDIKLGNVDNGELHSDAVTSDKISNGTITNEDIANDTIREGKIDRSSDFTFGGLTVNGTSTVNGNSYSNGFFYTSDISLKRNIREVDGLNLISHLEGHKFTWKSSDKDDYGFIAQEVERVIPELVRSNNGIKSVNYQGIIPLLVEAIKQQQKEIDELKKAKLSK